MLGRNFDTATMFNHQIMKALLKNALTIAALAVATQAIAQITFYKREGFEGRTFVTRDHIDNRQAHTQWLAICFAISL